MKRLVLWNGRRDSKRKSLHKSKWTFIGRKWKTLIPATQLHEWWVYKIKMSWALKVVASTNIGLQYCYAVHIFCVKTFRATHTHAECTENIFYFLHLSNRRILCSVASHHIHSNSRHTQRFPFISIFITHHSIAVAFNVELLQRHRARLPFYFITFPTYTW